jgi:hypothetical protein
MAQNESTKEVEVKLSHRELEALLIGLSEVPFRGKDIEFVYKLAVKLQENLLKTKP